MYKIWYLVWIWKHSIFGFWYKAPVVRIAHADKAAARRLGRLFTFDDLFGATTPVHQDERVAGEHSHPAAPAATTPATVAQ